MGESFGRTEDPDLIIWQLVGDVSIEDVARLYEVQLSFSRGKRGIFVLVDVSRMKNIPAEVRHAAAKGPGEGMPVVGTAVIGASFHNRVLGSMLNRAASLLRGVKEKPMRFFSTELEARSWIEELRRQADVREAPAPTIPDDRRSPARLR